MRADVWGEGSHTISTWQLNMKRLLFLTLLLPVLSLADTSPAPLLPQPTDAYEQNNLGWMYARGQGVEKNLAEALRLFQESADQGNPYGQINLGLMYENGTGVKQDKAEAIKWYRKAAEQGNEPAIIALQRLSAT